LQSLHQLDRRGALEIIMAATEQGWTGAAGSGDARAPYERPELRELSVGETQGGTINTDLETFVTPGGSRGSLGPIPDSDSS
jgi:hypothetical protein